LPLRLRLRRAGAGVLLDLPAIRVEDALAAVRPLHDERRVLRPPVRHREMVDVPEELVRGAGGAVPFAGTAAPRSATTPLTPPPPPPRRPPPTPPRPPPPSPDPPPEPPPCEPPPERCSRIFS